jgi:hypothetical protein
MFFVGIDSFDKSDAGLITSTISIYIEGKYFPEKEWNDAIIILSWWAEQLEPFFLKTSATADLIFMDGPFHVTLQLEGKKARLLFIEHEKIIDTVEMDFEELKILALKSIAETIQLSVGKCIENKWVNKDVVLLSKYYEILKKAFPGYVD